MTRTRKLVYSVLLLAAVASAASASFAGKVWRNREHLGRAWNCQRFAREAPPNLRALHAAEIAYRAEHGHFTTDLVALGFEPKKGTVPSIYYAYGFETPSTGTLAAGEDPSRNHSIELKAEGFAGTRLPPDTTASTDAFLAAATSEIFPEVGPDLWTIDQDGRLVHVLDGCWE